MRKVQLLPDSEQILGTVQEQRRVSDLPKCFRSDWKALDDLERV